MTDLRLAQPDDGSARGRASDRRPRPFRAARPLALSPEPRECHASCFARAL